MVSVSISGFCPVDVEAIYRSDGLNTHQHLKGDYTVEIVDGNKTIYITDFAGTQCVGKLPKNHTIVIEDNKIVYAKENISTSRLYYAPPEGLQPRTTYEEFFQAIHDAVKLRCTDDCWIAMSSGHDSGTIVASALCQGLSFKTLTVSAHEDMRVVDSRLALTNGVLINKWNKQREAHEVAAHNMQRLGGKVLLSGLGADEYLETKDYHLASTFFERTQHFYHDRGIQLRYPLLDPHVFFMYHALDPRLKGNKKPLKKFLQSLSFPYRKSEKIAFFLN